MQFNFDANQLKVVRRLIYVVGASGGVDRKTRRNLGRLMSKFEPSAKRVFLKPRDAAFVQILLTSAEKMLGETTEKLNPESDAARITEMNADKEAIKYVVNEIDRKFTHANR